MANLTVDNSFDEDDGAVVVKIDNPVSSTEQTFDDPFNATWEDIKKCEGLSPNFRRQVNRLEKDVQAANQKIDHMYDILIDYIAKSSRASRTKNLKK